MSPFKDDYKFDVVNQTSVKTPEAMPKYFLAETAEEAEEIYSQFSSLLNAIAYSYALSTGLPRADLFGEGLIGLGRAKRDWDADRGGEFRTYAIFRIKDAIIEYVRDHAAVVKVPTNLRKAQAVYKRLETACEAYGVGINETLEDTIEPYSLPLKQKRHLLTLVGTLIEYGSNAGVSDLMRFVERIVNLPEEEDYSEQIPAGEHARRQEVMEAALVVDKLKEHMDETEIAICNGIMMDLTYEEIGKGFGHGKSWVADKMAKLRKKIATKLKEGTL
jgi:RNA polymerase sigma factor (sigma-70 family)